jgi:Right handed beta helix region
MQFLDRRQAMKLASSFAAAFPLLKSAGSRAQVKPGTVVFEMAEFSKGVVDADAAFAKALAAISESAGEASKAGKPVPIVLNLEKNVTYRIKQPLQLKQLRDFELNGNEARLVNMTLGSTLLISGASHVTVRDLAIDYDPLPFTQGTISAFDHAALQITVKVDPGYPDDSKFLTTINDGFFKVMDRRTRALKPGARDFLTPSRIERVGDKLIKVYLRWSANDTFPSQLPIAVGDVVTMCNGYAHAIVVDGSLATTFYGLKLLASPRHGHPGKRRTGRDGAAERLHRSRAEARRRDHGSAGFHQLRRHPLITVERGPTIQDCTFANTSDDAVNVHGFYYYVVQKTAPRRYIVSPKWDIGLMAGDEIETCEQSTFRSLGRTKIVQLGKRKAPELKAKIAPIWKNKSPATQPDLVYDIELAEDLPLKIADSVTSLSRIGAGTAVRRCSFHACGHVVVKSPNSVVEECQFSYSSTIALQAGSDIGFWSESGFADNLILRNNHFDHSITGANALTEGNGALGTIYIGMSAPEGAKGFANSFQNRNITIQGNRIDNSFIYGIFVGNADGVRIIDNVIGQTFMRGSFDAGKFYGETPNSGIFIGRSRNAEISNNSVARGRIAKAAVAVDRTCVRESVHLTNNVLT